MSERKRLFFAVRFSQEVEAALGRLEERLARKVPQELNIKWVEPHNIHLTLQFLGDVDIGLIPKLVGGLKGAFTDIQPFETTLASVGAFPSLTRPRVVWVSFSSGAEAIKTVCACLLRVTTPLGFLPEDRPFSPHVTLGRVKHAHKTPSIADIVAALPNDALGQCQIDRVVLLSSELKPTGPVYTTIDSFPIGR